MGNLGITTLVRLMNEQDKRAVEGLARSGIEIEGLIEAFSSFPADEICEIYQTLHKNDDVKSAVTISINCS